MPGPHLADEDLEVWDFLQNLLLCKDQFELALRIPSTNKQPQTLGREQMPHPPGVLVPEVEQAGVVRDYLAEVQLALRGGSGRGRVESVLPLGQVQDREGEGGHRPQQHRREVQRL